ncbi:MAG: hypothetical protein IKJ14_01835 [Clostridia bacterium]|nr:hypothetical protein [Clostridia bacterium]
MKNYSAISEMYYGNRGGGENLICSNNEKESLTKLVKIENEFIEKIREDKSLLNIYNTLSNEQSELTALTMESVYKEGFRFGFLMALDVLDK